MLAYNIWRYFKIMAQLSNRKKRSETESGSLQGIQDNTIRIARLKLFLIAAKRQSYFDRISLPLKVTGPPCSVRLPSLESNGLAL